MNDGSTSTLRVDLNAYRHNLITLREMLGPECALMPVVKSNAYGHGATPIAAQALRENVPMLAVATVKEGLQLRDSFASIPILCLVQPSADELMAGIRADLRFTVANLEIAQKIGEFAHKVKTVVSVHCEVDTGMGRQGFDVETAAEQLRNLTRIPNVDVEGVFTHFPVADDDDELFTANQIRSFRTILRDFSKAGIPFEFAHAANSAGVIDFPESHFDMVRPGIITYGVYPTNVVPENSPFAPVASWKTRVVLVRDMPGGVSIGYGRRYRTSEPERLAEIPVGYADGLPRSVSNRADVLIRGTRCPIRGTISMNQTMVDVTHVPGVIAGDTVTIIGKDGQEAIRAEELAEHAGTIGYEILTGITASVFREYFPPLPELDEPS